MASTRLGLDQPGADSVTERPRSPLIGAFFLTFLLEYLRPIIPGTERYFIYGTIALVVYVLEPKGIYALIQRAYGAVMKGRAA